MPVWKVRTVSSIYVVEVGPGVVSGRRLAGEGDIPRPGERLVFAGSADRVVRTSRIVSVGPFAEAAATPAG